MTAALACESANFLSDKQRAFSVTALLPIPCPQTFPSVLDLSVEPTLRLERPSGRDRCNARLRLRVSATKDENALFQLLEVADV